MFYAFFRSLLDGKVFHSADCESVYGDFRGMPLDDCASLHTDLTSILADSGLMGWGIATDLKGLRLAFPDLRPEHNACSCFFRTMIFHVEKAHVDYPLQPIKIAFDRDTKAEHNSRLLFKYLAEESDPSNKQWLPSGPEFVTREELGVQAADLWVRELMKFLDVSLFSPDYKPRKQWDILLRTKRFGADLQFGSYFQSLKDQMATLEEKTGMTKDRFIAWLQKKRRQDNQSNRIEYIRDISARDRSRARGQDAATITLPDARKRRRFEDDHLLAPASDACDIDRAKTTIIFDTSGLNKLKNDPNQQAVLEELTNSYEVLISETSLVELSATKDSESRRQLVDVCERLLHWAIVSCRTTGLRRKCRGSTRGTKTGSAGMT